MLTLVEIGEILVEALAPECPICRGATVPRRGKFGWFWGCANFPRCHGSVTMNLARRAREEADRQEQILDEAYNAAFEDRVYGSDG